ncbi:MAG: helicase-related protein [Devosia sp.]
MTASPLTKRAERSRNLTAILGPTNTGKTHLAIERMLAHRTGVIGLPLRLLAREVYGRIVARLGPEVAALITGEEKILPPGARYYVATVEAMPLDLEVDFVAIDEVQLAGDLERGRVFTDRMLRVRGRYETLLLGASTARGLLERLNPGINVITRPRMSVLSYAGEKKLTRLPPRSAAVAFSANEVYAIAELVRRQRGGAAIVMGALSPRTRNAQVELFQSGDVDFLIATDAIGMGLNLDVDHVAFASNRKFDGYQYRALSAAELAQIAGRAGRHTRDGTFGVTGRVAPFDNELVEQLETHAFPQLKVFQWRNPELDFSSVPSLRRSLEQPPQEEGLTRAPPADDVKALEHAVKSPEVMDRAAAPAQVARLWDVCQVPDYRKIAPANHADLVLTLFQFIAGGGVIPDEWIARQVRYADKTDGDIDTLSNRIAHVRTWTFVANRNDWLNDPHEWRETTRAVEDRLSDALHERLMQRFVDRRTSVLMKRLRENAMLESEVNDAGDVIVEGQHVGALHGFRFQADASTGDPRDQKALRSAAAKALSNEMERRADKVSQASDAAFTLGSDLAVRWQGAVIAKLIAGAEVLQPQVVLLSDETLPQPAREKVQARLGQWLTTHVTGLLKPLFDLTAAEEISGPARGLAYRIAEGLGSVERAHVAEEAKGLDQTARAGLRALGVRFGAYHIFVPTLLKPAPSQLLALLWALKNTSLDVPGLTEVPQLSASGRTSIPVDPEVAGELYRVVGFRVCGPRAVRIDILERLADQIRPLVAWRPGPESGDPPPGAVPQGGGFLVTVTMTSLLGCSGEDFAAILTSLGYRVDKHEANEAERAAIAAAQEVRGRGAKKGGRDKPAADTGAEVATAPAGASTPAEGEAQADPSALAQDDTQTETSTPAEGGAHVDLGSSAEASVPTEAAAPVEEAATSTPETSPTEADAVAAEPAPSTSVEASAQIPQPTGTVSEGDTASEAALAHSDAPAASPETVDPAAPPAEMTETAPADAEAATPAEENVEPAPAEAAADAAAEPADTPQESAADPAEPILIEVWRVPRHQRSDQRHRRRGARGEGEAEGGHRRRRDGGRRSDEGQPADKAAGPRQDGPRSPGKRDDGREQREGRKGKRRNKPQRVDAKEQPRRNDTIDPNSPFAALAALKQQMEKGSDDR